MRILVQTSDVTHRNLGDVAMLQAAVARLRGLWPDALIQVPTSRPDLLSLYCPQAVPVSWSDQVMLLEEQCLLGRHTKLLPAPWHRAFLALQRWAWHQTRTPFTLAQRVKARWKGFAVGNPGDFLRELRKTDLVILHGAGAINDSFEWFAHDLLDTLHLATRCGIPAAALAQMIGPLDDPDLKAKAKAVLPRLTLITLREGRASLPRLHSLGVDPGRILVTGDAAVAPSYASRPKALGQGIGVNLRLAGYAGADAGIAARLAEAMRRIAAARDTALVPIAVQLGPFSSDLEGLKSMFPEMTDRLQECHAPNDPQSLIAQIGLCRVVVTGSYHGAVMAMAQGIPAVGLVGSAYYSDKFLGLREQFGVGCEVVSLEDPHFPEALSRTVDEIWEAADDLRPKLLKSAVVQIEADQAAYRRLRELLNRQS